MKKQFSLFIQDIDSWRRGWGLYIERRTRTWGRWFETQKDLIVDILIARRGGYQRPFLHLSVTLMVVVGIVSAPILAESYPGKLPDALSDYTPPSEVFSSLDPTEYGVQTQVSEKPRDQVISYSVQNGDTLAGVSEKFGVSIDTIKWANDLKKDNLSINQELKIPPVTGVVHNVKEGETVYSIAKRYKTTAQQIVNFPFNEFSDLDTFALVAGQSLVVPDGAPPQSLPALPRPGQVPVIPPTFAGGTGQFSWPAGGTITQYPVWYHMAIDIANNTAPGIGAAGEGVVTLVEYLQYGYGHHAVIDHGDGTSTLYGHMTDIYVKPGDRVSRGQIIGRMGSTGRSTGTHLHFEVRRNGVTVNPLPFLR